jgi:hypothetical protein
VYQILSPKVRQWFSRVMRVVISVLTSPVAVVTRLYLRCRETRRRDILLCCSDPLMADYLRPFRELFRDDPRLRFRVVKEVLTTPRLSEERIKYIDEQLLLPCVGSFWARARAWDLVVCADHCFGGARRRSPSIYIGHGRQCKTYPHDDFEYTYGRGSVERGRPAYRKIFSASEADRETIVKAKPLFSDVVVVVGNLENDRLMAQSARRDEFRRQFGYKPDDVVVFVVSTFGKYCLWHTMGDSLLEAARGLLGQFTFVLSAHPHEYRRKPPGERVWGALPYKSPLP